MQQKNFDPRALEQKGSFLKTEHGDLYYPVGARLFHVPSDLFKQRILNEKSILRSVVLVSSVLLANYASSISLPGQKMLVLLTIFFGAFLAYRLGLIFIVRYLDAASQKRTWMERCDMKSRNFHPFFLAFCTLVFLGGGAFFAHYVPPVYKNYIYYKTSNEKARNAPPVVIKPQKPSVEYLQWMKEHGVTEGQLSIVSGDLKDYTKQEWEHSQIMEKDTLLSLILLPIIPLFFFAMALWTIVLTRLSMDHH